MYIYVATWCKGYITLLQTPVNKLIGIIKEYVEHGEETDSELTKKLEQN